MPAQPSRLEEFAATECQNYLYKITGRLLPRVSEVEEPAGYTIHIGQTRANQGLRLDPHSRFEGANGYRIVPGARQLSIFGGDDLGTVYGVYDFLERQGVRWFSTNAEDEVVPRLSAITIPEDEVLEIPDFSIRWIQWDLWALRNRMNIRVKINDEDVGVQWRYPFHSFYHFLDQERYYDNHPEWYTLVDGIRKRPEQRSHDWQICTSNGLGVRQVAGNIIRMFETDPDLDIVSLVPNGGGGYCECVRCRALDDPRSDWWGRYSNRIHHFSNEVARLVRAQFPDKIVRVNAFAQFLRYPTLPGYTPEENIAVQVNHSYACYTHSILNMDCRYNRNNYTREVMRWSDHAAPALRL